MQTVSPEQLELFNTGNFVPERVKNINILVDVRELDMPEALRTGSHDELLESYQSAGLDIVNEVMGDYTDKNLTLANQALIVNDIVGINANAASGYDAMRSNITNAIVAHRKLGVSGAQRYKQIVRAKNVVTETARAQASPEYLQAALDSNYFRLAGRLSANKDIASRLVGQGITRLTDSVVNQSLTLEQGIELINVLDRQTIFMGFYPQNLATATDAFAYQQSIGHPLAEQQIVNRDVCPNRFPYAPITHLKG